MKEKEGNDSCSQGGACCFKIPTCCLFWICNALWKQKGTKRSSLSKERRERDRDRSKYRQINETRDREKTLITRSPTRNPSRKCTSGELNTCGSTCQIGGGVWAQGLELTGRFLMFLNANQEESHRGGWFPKIRTLNEKKKTLLGFRNAWVLHEIFFIP